MIKAKLTGKDKEVMLLGLSKENILRLQSGDPILTTAKEMGFGDFDIIIMAGETEEEIQETVLDTFKSSKVVIHDFRKKIHP